MNTLREFTSNLMRLIYPDDCPGCRRPTNPGHLFCAECTYHLKVNDLHLHKDNLFTIHFKGRVPFVTGAAMYIYRKGGRVQTLIQSIKYNGSIYTAQKIGLRYGKMLKASPLYRNIDIIIPVPLHPSKKRIRGYNQSAWFAKGLAVPLEARVDSTSVIRGHSAESQTRHNRWERAENLQNAFSLTTKQKLKGKHILIADDVLTTGATLESMAMTILKAEPASLRFCTIAMGLQ